MAVVPSPFEAEVLDKLGSMDKAINDLFRTVDKILGVVDKSHIAAKPVAATTQPAPVKVAPGDPKNPNAQRAASFPLSNIETAKMHFPESLAAMLDFEEKPGFMLIKAKQFLGSENFAKIASVVRGIGGEYVSAGRDSHFRLYPRRN